MEHPKDGEKKSRNPAVHRAQKGEKVQTWGPNRATKAPIFKDHVSNNSHKTRTHPKIKVPFEHTQNQIHEEAKLPTQPPEPHPNRSFAPRNITELGPLEYPLEEPSGISPLGIPLSGKATLGMVPLGPICTSSAKHFPRKNPTPSTPTPGTNPIPIAPTHPKFLPKPNLKSHPTGPSLASPMHETLHD